MKNKAIFSIFLSLGLVVSGAAISAPRLAHAQNFPCTITSFSATPNNIAAGSSATLSWTSTGCQYISLAGGQFISPQYLMPNSSTNTGPLTGTTTYYISATSDTTSAVPLQTTVYVAGGPYPYIPGSVNIGATNPSLTALTTPASNVGQTTARLNGVVTNAGGGTYTAHFEYGTDYLILDRATPTQSGFSSTSQVSATISIQPSTTYYYRMVAQAGGSVYYGEVYSLTALASTAAPTTSSTTSSSSTSTTPAAVTLTITNASDKINIGDTIEDTVSYVNNTGQTLKNSTLSVVFPMGFIVKQSTEGVIANATTVSDSIGTIAPGQKGSIFIQATIGPTTSTSDTLVTNGTLAYTLPDGTHDSAVGYVINHAGTENVFAGFALGSGFFPSTIFGWLITVIIILTLILIARRVAKSKQAAHGHAPAHGAHATHDPHEAHNAPKH